MKLNEWLARSVLGGGEQWARQRAKDAILTLSPDDADPVVYASTDASASPDVVVKAWAALSVGLTSVTVATQPKDSSEAKIELAVESWAGVAPTLRLEGTGDPEDRYPLIMAAGSQRIESRRLDGPELVTLFIECTRLSRSA